MTKNSHREPWEWRELLWNEVPSPDKAANALEHLASTASLGVVVFEFRVTNAGARWLIAAHPGRLDHVIAALKAHLPLRAHTVRRIRQTVKHAGRLRVMGGHLSFTPERVKAAVRGLYGSLSGLPEGEEVVLQLMLGRRHTPPVRRREPPQAWLDILLSAPAAGTRGRTDAATRRGDEQHGFSATLRVGIHGANETRARLLAGQLIGALRVLETTASRLRLDVESTTALNEARLPWRWPLRLTSGELVGLTGWPIGEPPLPLLGSLHPRQLPPPTDLVRTERIIGRASAPGHNEAIGIPIRDAAYHTHLLGPTGSAKSTVMLALITADMQAGRSVLVIDPKGDLATDVLARVPKERKADVVVLDPTNPCPVGSNPLAGSARQASVRADSLLAAFESVFAQNWGIRSADIFTGAFLTLSRVRGANLLWLPPLLTNPAFRKKVISQVDDPLGVGAFWQQYDAKKPERQLEEIGPVLNKLRQLILRPGLRAVLGQSAPKFDLDELISQRRIVVVNLNKGILGHDASRLFGTLLIGQLWSRILARQSSLPAHRHIVSIYIDEVHDFLAGIPGGDLSDALAQARSLGAAFTVANQYLAQLTPAMRQAIETNTRSKIFFGLGATDASTIAKHAAGLEAQDFMLLPKYHAYANIMQHGQNTGWITLATTPPVPTVADSAAVYAASHQRYGVQTAETEQQLLDLFTPPGCDQNDDGNDEPIGRARA